MNICDTRCGVHFSFGVWLMYYFIAVLMCVFAYVQLNDPDPWIWCAVYLVVAVMSFLAANDRMYPRITLLLISSYVVAAVLLWPSEYRGVTEMQQSIPQIELARESLGLGVCCIVLGFVYSKGRTKKSK